MMRMRVGNDRDEGGDDDGEEDEGDEDFYGDDGDSFDEVE